LKIKNMKKLENSQMENVSGSGTGRKCLIDGALTAVAMGVGAAGGGVVGMVGAFVGGMVAANANGCFS
jgi:hypothetical protein